MKRLLLLIAIVASYTSATAAASIAWPVRVSPNGRYFVDRTGQAVFWLGTTQWELFRGYKLEDAQLILDKSKDKGFVFVQTMLMGVGDGTRTNVYGQKPWLHDDPLTPDEAYFRNVDAVIQAARERDMILYVMAYHQTCRKRITVDNARSWAKWLAQRYKEMPNIIWSLTPEAKPEFVPILRELATGESGAGGSYANAGVPSFTTPVGWEDSLLILESRADRPGNGAAAAEVPPAGRDSAALAAALQRSEAGTTIRLPEGTFELTESVRLKSGVKLIGSGQDKTIFIYSGDQPAPFINLTDCEDVEIAHLTLDGRLRPLGQDGIRAGNCRKLRLHDLTIRNLAKGKSSFVHGIIFSGHNPTMERGVTDSIISDCCIETIGLGAEYGGGIRMAWGSGRNRVERNVIRDTGRGGIFGDHSAELVIRNNQVSGSGGEGLGIEIWGGCPRSLIEDNVVDHWISVDQGNQSAVRRNVVGVEDDSLKGFGIEIIASDIIVTDNLVKRGASVGLSVSNKPKKNNVFWGYNTIRECVQWGAQLQGETGGIARHYFYHCSFEKTIRGDPRARYPQDSGHGFRFNGSSRALVFEECAFRDNGGYGVQFGGSNVDGMTFLRCVFANNRQGLVTGLSADKTVEFKDCTAGAFPPTQAFSNASPAADFRMPPAIHAGAAAPFECTSKSGAGEIVQRLWDFNHGIAEVGANPKHTFDQPGKYRVTLIVWDAAERGARVEKIIEVLPAQ